jgi:hypothetical protein
MCGSPLSIEVRPGQAACGVEDHIGADVDTDDAVRASVTRLVASPADERLNCPPSGESSSPAPSPPEQSNPNDDPSNRKSQHRDASAGAHRVVRLGC